MAATEFPITTASGMGPLPEWLEAACGRKCLERAFVAARLPEAVVRDPSLVIPHQSMVEIFAQAARASGDPAAGLKIGLASKPGDLGTWLRYAVGGATLRAALDRVAWAMPLFQRGPVFSLVETEAGAVWHYRTPRYRNIDRRHHSEHVVPMLLAFLRNYLGRAWLPQWIETDTARDGREDLLAELLGTPWRMGGPAISIPLSRSDLAAPTRDPDHARLAPTSLQVRANLEKGREDITAALAALILLDLAEEQVGIEHAAARLQIGVRSLQRRLAVAGQSYRDVLQKVREEQARALLSETRLSVAEIAYSLGYTEPGNFTRAFTGWTGMAPTAYAHAVLQARQFLPASVRAPAAPAAQPPDQADTPGSA
ncbi:AraC family transcriptional regulator [Poseidonocella sp. HB161398]|uniref:AraC family transcriptional regulator n=1 Tax=Poseidonocella sp. HB161398 TaxID=2320855 RepID=UPI0011091BC0|nr:AraC family transcriptional regulator [Poseidonocella sp. HB161398]